MAAERHPPGRGPLLLRELAASSARPLALLNVAAGSILVTLESAPNSLWLGQWQDTGLYLTVYGFVISGTLASIGGAMAYRDTWIRRRDVLSGVSKSSLAVSIFAVTPVLVWLGTSHLVVSGSAVVRTYLLNPDPMNIVPVMALSLMAIVFHACVGFTLAAVFAGKMPALLIASLAPYAMYFASDSLQLANLGRWSQLFGFYIGPGWSPAMVGSWWPLAHLVTYIVFLSAVLLLTVSRTRNRTSGSGAAPRWVPLVLVAGLLASGTSLVGLWTSERYERIDARGVQCERVSARVIMCLWPSQEWQRGAWAEAASRVAATAGELEIGPITVLPAGSEPTDSEQLVVPLTDNPSPNDIYWGIVSRVVRREADRCGGGTVHSPNELSVEEVLLEVFADPDGNRGDAVRLLATC